MRQLQYKLKTEPIRINIVETDDDLDGFIEFVRNNQTIAFDTETTGLLIYANTFKIRVAQFSNASESWVIPVERSVKWSWLAANALLRAKQLIIQNAAFDIPVVVRHWGLDMRELFEKTIDTKILAKLVDSRSVDAGGTGDSLEDLTAHYIDKTTAAEIKGLATAEAKRLKIKKDEYFTKVSIRDHNYLLYAGMDPILTYRLWKILGKLVPSSARQLIGFEHEVQRVCTEVSHRGYLLDLAYAKKLSSKLRATETRNVNVARSYGIENVNSDAEVIDALRYYGWFNIPVSEKGNESVNGDLLQALQGSGYKDLAKLGKAIQEATRARKWRNTWVDTFIHTADAEGYCHPSINTLQARTGRMSITGIPAQTLPAGEASIRLCFLAEEGHVSLSTDYQAQELRVLAALSQDPVMLDAFKRGLDLHQVTADAAGVTRKAGKGTNFAVVFGGGVNAIVTQFGVERTDAEKTYKAFKETYLGVAAYSRRLSNQAKRQGYIVTPSGRKLLIDPDRPYSATNAAVQSTARDVTCRGLLRLDKEGFTPYIRLPIHDEIVFSVPAEHEEYAARRTNELMQEEMAGLMISTEAEAMGRSWGSLYEDPDSNRKYVLDS